MTLISCNTSCISLGSIPIPLIPAVRLAASSYSRSVLVNAIPRTPSVRRIYSCPLPSAWAERYPLANLSSCTFSGNNRPVESVIATPYAANTARDCAPAVLFSIRTLSIRIIALAACSASPPVRVSIRLILTASSVFMRYFCVSS